MKKLIEALIGLEDFKQTDEFQRMKEITDLEEQGYASGPVLAKLLGLTPEELLESILTIKERQSANNATRDEGVKRWCHDNIAKDDESH